MLVKKYCFHKISLVYLETYLTNGSQLLTVPTLREGKFLAFNNDTRSFSVDGSYLRENQIRPICPSGQVISSKSNVLLYRAGSITPNP